MRANDTKKKGIGKSGEYPLVGVRPPQDVEELLKAARRDNFAGTFPKVFVRTARLHLMPLYGHLKRVKVAVAAMKARGELT